jgi:hypothetical protein
MCILCVLLICVFFLVKNAVQYREDVHGSQVVCLPVCTPACLHACLSARLPACMCLTLSTSMHLALGYLSEM